jgi:anti-sigma factor RsiW
MGCGAAIALSRSQEPMNTSYMTCQELVELVTEYVEGALPPVERARFEEHIMTCPPCRAHLDQMRRTIDVLGALPASSLSPEAEQALLAAFRDWKQS